MRYCVSDIVIVCRGNTHFINWKPCTRNKFISFATVLTRTRRSARRAFTDNKTLRESTSLLVTARFGGRWGAGRFFLTLLLYTPGNGSRIIMDCLPEWIRGPHIAAVVSRGFSIGVRSRCLVCRKVLCAPRRLGRVIWNFVGTEQIRNNYYPSKCLPWAL